MAIELTTILQHANNVVVRQADDKQMYINDQGDISGRSGLSFFKRHFSSSARTEENRATLQAFQESIAANPKYRTQLESEQVVRFFQTKREQGTPLTAWAVQQVKAMLDIEKTSEIGAELVELGLIPNLDATGFAWFCVGKGLSADSPEDIKEALKTYYTSQHCDDKARQSLAAAGVKPENLEAAMRLLKASSAWSSALDGAFEGNVSELTHAIIMDRFGAALEKGADLLSDMVNERHMPNSFLLEMASSKGSRGVTLFNGTLEAISKGAIAAEEGSMFVVVCTMERYDLSTPELLNAAIGKYCTNASAEKIFTCLATDNGLAADAGKALAHNPEFEFRVDSALAKVFTPPAVPTRQQIDTIITDTATVFLAEKNDAIRSLLALAEKNSGFDPALAEAVGLLDQKGIIQMLNPLLSGQALLDHLLDPGKGSDLNMIRLLENFQSAMISCQHTVEGEFGGPEMADLTVKALAVLMKAREADGETMGTLLGQVNKAFATLGPSLDALYGGLMQSSIKVGDLISAVTSVNHVQNAMRLMANFAYNATSGLQKKALGISTTPEEFYTSLETGPGGRRLPASDMHQSVRAFAETLGVRIGQVAYKETVALAESEALAFTGTTERPVVTDLLRDRAGAIAREIGLTQFNPAGLDPIPLGIRIAHAVQGRDNELLTPAQAREVAEQAIREYLQELKPAMDFIAGLPTEPNPDAPQQFVVTPAEKQRLLKVIPGTPLRDPELIKTSLLEARSLVTPIKRLMVPGLSDADMVAPLLQISSMHLNLVGSLRLQGSAKDEVYGAYKAALTLALDDLQLTPQQTVDLFDMVSGPRGVALGRSLVSMASLCEHLKIPDAGVKKAGLMGGMSGMDNLRLILGPRVGVAVDENLFYYAEAMDVQDISGSVFAAAESVLHIRSTDMPGYAALSMVAPKLTRADWDTLLPILQTVGNSFDNRYDHEYATKMVAANARELLVAAEANRGRPLNPTQIWRTVIGGNAPEGTTADNLGTRMYETAIARIVQRAQAINPDKPVAALQPFIQFYLSKGIPFQTLYNAYQPGGRLVLEDLRFGAPTLSSLSGYSGSNAYGLTTDWGRRQASRNGNPSMMTINTGSDKGFVIGHRSIPEGENVADNPIFVRIMERCRSITRSDLQFRRVMQSLSQAGTINLRMLAESFPGLTLSEHSHFDSTVTPQPNGNILVEFRNSEDDHPFGAHLQITITPTGETSVTDIGVELRG